MGNQEGGRGSAANAQGTLNIYAHTQVVTYHASLYLSHICPNLSLQLASAVMDENPRFSEVLNLSELKEAFCTSCLRLLFFWRGHTDSVTKNMLTISTKPSACMSVHIAAIQIEGGLKRKKKWGGCVHN